MYKALFRPVLFLIDPEIIHHLVVFLVSLLNKIPGINKAVKSYLTYNHPLLRTTIAGIEFPNKVGMAAGFDKNAEFYNGLSLFGFSFIEIGTVTPLPQPGNDKPRLFRLPKDKALINRMGFNNKGVDYAARQLLNRNKSVIIGGNIGKNTATPNEKAADDYTRCFEMLYDAADYFVLNVSCPNIKDLDKLQDYESLKEILEQVLKVRAAKPVRKPVFLKISPDISFGQVDDILALYQVTGLDGIVATNTTNQRSDLKTNKNRINQIGSGGLSGYPLKNRTLEMISYICKQSNNRIPVIGVGGIISAVDAVDMIKAGASLVQVYTGFIYDGPLIVRRINKAIKKYLSALST
jgi:dihydroorotate dehydrogenase